VENLQHNFNAAIVVGWLKKNEVLLRLDISHSDSHADGIGFRADS